MKLCHEKSRLKAAVPQMGTTLVSLSHLCHPDSFEVPSSDQPLLSLSSLSLSLQMRLFFLTNPRLGILVSQTLTSLISVSTPILRVTETGF